MKMLKILIIFCATLTLSIVYAPQPIAPLLSNYFHVNLHQISWIISVTLIPLAIAPLVYGYLLEIFSLKKILVVSLFLCSIFGIIGNLNDNFYFFLFLRFLQALCIPVVQSAPAPHAVDRAERHGHPSLFQRLHDWLRR